jgi:hypothetical protein
LVEYFEHGYQLKNKAKGKNSFEYMPFKFDGYPGSLPSLGSGKAFNQNSKDYENWLKQIEVLSNGLILPPTLIRNCNRNGATQNIGGKMIPQLEAQTATDTLKIFFMNR